MADYLDNLDLSDEERTKLRALGVKTPYALLSLRKASKAAFDQHLGSPQRADAIELNLRTLLTAEELAQLNRPARQGGRLGARSGPPPSDENKH